MAGPARAHSEQAELIVARFTQTLRRERKRRRITQAAAAARIGLSPNQIYRYEVGQQSPRLHDALDWALALGFDVQIVLSPLPGPGTADSLKGL